MCCICCKNTSETPVAKPLDFDRKKYADSLKLTDPPDEKQPVPAEAGMVSEVPDKDIRPFTDTIKFTVHNGKAEIDTVKKPRQKLVFVFDTDTAERFSVSISTADSTANLRISQVIDSKGNSDGPFGRNLEYKILEKGTHKMIISESQMAGVPWEGRFKFELKLLW